MATIPGTSVAATIVPTDSADTHATHDQQYGKGGWREVAALAERDAIAVPRRREGMVVYVVADSVEYVLGADLATWTAKPTGGAMTDAEVKTAYENNINTNELDDAEKANLHAPGSDDQDLSNLVTKVVGSSLVPDTEIAKIHAAGTDIQDISGIATNATAISDHATNHPAPTTRDIRNQVAGSYEPADSTILKDADIGVTVAPVLGINENYITDDEKTKLSGLESSHFKGSFVSKSALDLAFPSAVIGDYADVDTGIGSDTERYIWDGTDSIWVVQAGASTALTDAQIKTQYENNPDTNALRDTEKANLHAPGSDNQDLSTLEAHLPKSHATAHSGLDAPDSHPAAAITNTPAGNIVSADQQSVNNELDAHDTPAHIPLVTLGLTATIYGATITKTSSGWSGAVKSVTPITGQCGASVRVRDALMWFGITQDAISATTQFSTVDYCFIAEPGVVVSIRENGVLKYTGNILISGDTLGITFDNISIKYYMNGGLVYTSVIIPTAPLSFGLSMYYGDTTASDCRFTPAYNEITENAFYNYSLPHSLQDNLGLEVAGHDVTNVNEELAPSAGQKLLGFEADLVTPLVVDVDKLGGVGGVTDHALLDADSLDIANSGHTVTSVQEDITPSSGQKILAYKGDTTSPIVIDFSVFTDKTDFTFIDETEESQYFIDYPSKKAGKSKVAILSKLPNLGKVDGLSVFGDNFINTMVSLTGVGVFSVDPQKAPKLPMSFKIGYSISPSSITISGSLSPTTVIKTIGVWCKNPTSNGKAFTILITASSGNYIECELGIKPNSKWTYLTATDINFQNNTFTNSDVISSVTFKERNETSFYPASYPDWAVGDFLLFGNVDINLSSRPKFIIWVDDAVDTILYNGPGFPTGYPATGGNYTNILDYYGFKGVAAIPISTVGSGAGFLTWDEVDTVFNNGWDIIGHGNEIWWHTTAAISGQPAWTREHIRSSYYLMKKELDTRGYRGDFVALPSGMWDTVSLGVLKEIGIQCIRGVSVRTGGYFTFPQGYPSSHDYFQRNPLTQVTSSLGGDIHLPSSMDIEDTPDLAEAKAYIDNLISYGATGGLFAHEITDLRATHLDSVLAYLKTKVDSGLIDVVTMTEWYESVYDYGDLNIWGSR